MPEALSEGLDVPVDIKWGHVGLFQLSVPWSKLGSKPVSIVVDKCFIRVSVCPWSKPRPQAGAYYSLEDLVAIFCVSWEV